MAATVVHALRWWARTKPAQTALVVGDDEATYGELHDWTGRFARRLADAGVVRGDRVAILGGNTLEWCVAALGALKAGAVVTPLNPRLVASELSKIVGNAAPTVVVAAPEFAGRVDEVAGLGHDFTVVPLADVAACRSGGADDFLVDVDPDDPIVLIFTSGTTGLSKGVILTNRTMLSIVFEASLTEPGLHPGTRILLVLPLCFTPGIAWGLLMTTTLGGTLVVQPELDPSGAVRLLEQHRIEVMFGVPLIFQAISSAPEFDGADLSALQTLHTGGAAVPVPLLERWMAKGAALRQIYGLTEAGGTATATLLAEAAEHPDTCGVGNIFTEFTVVDESGAPCPPGQPGEVLLRGPSMTPGYWNDPETTAKAIRDGWLYSGDLGVVDEDGRLKFVDRMKDLIITGGINVSPVEIEATLSEVDSVAEVAVLSASDEKFGETPAALVVPAEGADPAAVQAAVLEHATTHLADFKVPRYIVVRDEPLPRLASGKIAKVALRDEYKDIADRYQKVR